MYFMINKYFIETIFIKTYFSDNRELNSKCASKFSNILIYFIHRNTSKTDISFCMYIKNVT